MNLFIELGPQGTTSLALLRARAMKALRSLENFGYFLGKEKLTKDDVNGFLDELEQFLDGEAYEDVGVSLVNYGDKKLYVCCAREEDMKTSAPYFISAFNLFPEELCEGTGIRYWG